MFWLYFSAVYAEVETRIGALRSLLLEKLLQTPSTLHDQKRYIRSLYSSMTLFKFGYFSLHVYSVSIQQKVMTSPSTPFGFFDVCLCHRLPELQPPPPTLFLFFPLSLSSVHQSYFCCLALLFLLLFFSPPVFLFLLFFPLHPSVHSYLWSLPIYYCEDQPVRIRETSSQPHGKWQHLSSWYIRHSSERPLSSCLLFTWMVEAVCVCVPVCVWVCALVLFLFLKLLKDTL